MQMTPTAVLAHTMLYCCRTSSYRLQAVVVLFLLTWVKTPQTCKTFDLHALKHTHHSVSHALVSINTLLNRQTNTHTEIYKTTIIMDTSWTTSYPQPWGTACAQLQCSFAICSFHFWYSVKTTTFCWYSQNDGRGSLL